MLFPLCCPFPASLETKFDHPHFLLIYSNLPSDLLTKVPRPHQQDRHLLAKPGDTANAIKHALDHGHHGENAALAHSNEEEVIQRIKAPSVRREEL